MQDRTRKIAVTGILGAVTILLGLTRWGFIPWFGGISLTIMHIPVIIGAILEGPLVGAGIGLIFGLFSMLQAAIAPASPSDVWFTNPLLSILPRLFIGPIAWLVYHAFRKWQIPAIILGAVAGSALNTILVLGMMGLLNLLPWQVLATIAAANGLPEIAASALITFLVIVALKQIRYGKKQGADL